MAGINKMDKRFKQAHKEALCSVLLTLAYLFCWAITAYFLGQEPGIFGLPRWFEVSCLFVPIFFVMLCILMIKMVYQDLPLGTPPDEI